MNKEILFPNTELTKDHIEDILDIDPPKQPSQGMSRCSEFLSREFLALPDNVDAAPQRAQSSKPRGRVPWGRRAGSMV